jgi:hypothetical protein
LVTISVIIFIPLGGIMSKPTVYLGETNQKRLARLAVFESLRNRTLPDGWFVMLAGPEAGDVGCLRHILKVDPAKVVFVENDPKHRTGLNKAVQQWPGVRTYFGDLRHFLKTAKEPISMLNADLMGPMKLRDTEIFELVTTKLKPGSVVSYTFYRGREREDVSLFGGFFLKRELEKYSEREAQRQQRNEDRFWLYEQVMRRAMHRRFQRLAAISYQSWHKEQPERRSPMGVITLRHPQSMEVSFEAPSMSIEGSDSDVRRKVLRLHWQGHDSNAVASILNVRVGSVRAWLANETRGSYKQ